MMSRSFCLASLFVLFGAGAWAQAPDWQRPGPLPQPSVRRQQPQFPQNAPPRSDQQQGSSEESSSKSTKIDLSPPPGDANHPGSAAAEDVNEFHVYDPHRAEKDVEVGDFYFKRKNYVAAISRYRSALKWKPNDAIATFHLAQALEKTGQLEDARQSYESYLKILPHGPNAKEAQAALERLTLQSESRTNPADKPRR